MDLFASYSCRFSHGNESNANALYTGLWAKLLDVRDRH